MTKTVLSDIKRHHVEEDNARLREALRTINELVLVRKSVRPLDPVTLAALNDMARIARTALVSAAPANTELRAEPEVKRWPSYAIADAMVKSGAAEADMLLAQRQAAEADKLRAQREEKT